MKSKFMTWNIQAAIGTTAFHQYITGAYRQIAYAPKKIEVLGAISRVIAQYDLIALQEVDLGGRRSNFECQFDYLKAASKLPFGAKQENRTVGNFSRHGNAILSRYPISEYLDLKLPGSRTGRGVMIARIEAPQPFYAVNTHLSLGQNDQTQQLLFIADNLPVGTPYIFMGDLNCVAASDPTLTFAKKTGGRFLTQTRHKSYPSWSPSQDYDHIVLGPDFSPSHIMNETLIEATVLDLKLSDHRPVVVDLSG